MAPPPTSGHNKLYRLQRSGKLALRRVTVRNRPLPDFLVIGAQKAGTTSLHTYLCAHPEVMPSFTKEVHYFDQNFHRGTGWYRSHFRRGPSGAVGGEATPYYLFHPLAPERASGVAPGCRLIALLRDPVDRAFSHYNHAKARGAETLDFEPALAAEPERLAGEEDRLLADPTYSSFSHQHHSYLARGFYADQLERWFERFDRERILVLSAEDLFAEPERVLHEAQRFLGLAPHTPGDLSPRNARRYAPIDERLRTELRRRFAPANQRLYALLDRDFGWDRPLAS